MSKVLIVFGRVHTQTVLSPRRIGYRNPAYGQNVLKSNPLDELPDWPEKSAFQKLQEQLERQIRPLRQIKEMHDLGVRPLSR